MILQSNSNIKKRFWKKIKQLIKFQMHLFLFLFFKISYSTFEISNYLKNTHKKYF